MAIKPKKQMPANKGETGGGVRGGIGNKIKAAITKKSPAKPLKEPKSAVKVVPPMPPAMRKAMNDYATSNSMRMKSGKAAKDANAAREQNAAMLKKRAAAKDAAETARILAKGGKVVMNPTKKSVTRNGVTVRQNPQYRVNTSKSK